MIFKILQVISEEIKSISGEKVNVETLVCEVEIGSDKRILNFNWNQILMLYKSKEVVYVRIPQYGTKRAYGINENVIYNNKVRKSSLYIQKTELEYHLITEYEVLDGKASIVAWTDSKTGLELSNQEAVDYNSPYPIKKT